MTETTRPHYPMFDEYTLDTLMQRLGYSGEYLLDVRAGRKNAGFRFRKTCCGILNRSEAELFGEAVEEGAR